MMLRLRRFLVATVAIAALALVGCPGSSSADGVTSVTVDPAEAVVYRGGQQPFTATVTVTGDVPTTVTWSIVGTGHHANTGIDGTGQLTVYFDEPLDTLTVRATSTADGRRYGQAVVSVEDAPFTVTSVTVDPEEADVSRGESLQFTAAVTGTGDFPEIVTWSLVGTGHHANTGIGGTTGLLSVYIGEPLDTLTVRATSTADSRRYGEAVVSVVGANFTITSVTVAPEEADVYSGESLQFTATVTGTGNVPEIVTWSIVGTGHHANTGIGVTTGLLSVYILEPLDTLTVRATSTVDGRRYGLATVTVNTDTGMIAWQLANLAASNPADGSTHTLTTGRDYESIPPWTLYFDGNRVTVTLTGGGTLSLSSTGAMFTVGTGVTLILDDVELRGRSDNTDALIAVADDGALEMDAGAVITGNTNVSEDGFGGGVRVAEDGTFIMRGGEIRGNSAVRGGGVHNLGGFDTGGTITENDAAQGGGVYNFGVMRMRDGATVSENRATTSGVTPGWGGGILNRETGTVFMHDAVVYGNFATAQGGGVWTRGTIDIDTGIIVGRNLVGDAVENGNTTTGGAATGGQAAFVNLEGQIRRGTLNQDGTFAGDVYYYVMSAPGSRPVVPINFTIEVLDGELERPVTAAGVVVTGVGAYDGYAASWSATWGVGINAVDITAAATVSGGTVTVTFVDSIPVGSTLTNPRLVFQNTDGDTVGIYERGPLQMGELPGTTEVALDDFTPQPTQVDSITVTGIPERYLGVGGDVILKAFTTEGTFFGNVNNIPMALPASMTSVTFSNPPRRMEPGVWRLVFELWTPQLGIVEYQIDVNLEADNTIPFEDWTLVDD